MHELLKGKAQLTIILRSKSSGAVMLVDIPKVDEKLA